MTETLPHILIVDDEPAIRSLLRTMLTTQGYVVSEASDAEGALKAARLKPAADVLLLDLALPDKDGFSIIKELRVSGDPTPIIVLSNRDDEHAKVIALDLGADDYVTKPFAARELFARIRASMRHKAGAIRARHVFKHGDLAVDLLSRVVTLCGKEVKLSSKEYALLALLINNAGRVVTHTQILREVWKGESDPQYIRIYVRSLRQKLREAPENPRYILTEQGVGYRFSDS
jgi:two-component system KDP operon response regulator KdpE